MRSYRPKMRALLAALLAALASLAGAVAQPAQAQLIEPDFRAWNVRADFTGGAARVLLTTYEGLATPPTILRFSQTDISANCTQVGAGAITFGGGQATFDGRTRLQCELPPALMADFADDRCEADAAGFWFFSAEGKLPSSSQANPIVTASDDSFRFSLPSTGANVRTRAQIASVGYQTPQWPRSGSGNEVLIGQNGPLIVRAGFDVPLLLDNLAAGWDPFFSGLSPSRVGHSARSSSSASTWSTAGLPLPYQEPPQFVYFGSDAAGAVYYSGKLTNAEVDPPGCTVL